MRRATSFGVLMLALLATRGAFGADESMEQRRAAGPFKEGLALAGAGKNEEARVAFAQAYAAYASPNILFNLAKSEALTGRTTSALRHFKQVVRDTRATAEAIRMSNEQVVALNKITGHAKVTAPPGASITLDGEAYADRPPLADVIDVMPGDHGIKADLDGKHAEAMFHASAGATVEVTLAWPVAAPVPSAPATTTSSAPLPPPPPRDTITPPSNQEVTWTVPRGALTGGFAAVGIVGLVVGIAGVSSASSADDRITRDKSGVVSCTGVTTGGCADLGPAYDARSSAHAQELAGFIIAGVGVVGAVATTVYWYKTPVVVNAAPVAVSGGGGLSLFGSF